MIMYDLFERFYPRIIDVFHRDPEFWKASNYKVQSAQTKIRSLLYVYDGQGVLELDGVRYDLYPGYVFQMPVRHQLLLQTTPDNALCYYTVQYDFKWVDWDGGTIRFEDPEEKHLPFDIVMSLSDPENIHSQMVRLYEIWTDKKSGFLGQSRLIFLHLLQQVSEQQNCSGELDPNQRLIKDSILYIRNHYDQPFDREQLAKKVSLSASYFSIVFKKYTGCSPVQYVTRVRLDKAKQLLRESALTISEVAYAVGFRDPLYFTRVFTHQVGVSPREYRTT